MLLRMLSIADAWFKIVVTVLLNRPQATLSFSATNFLAQNRSKSSLLVKLFFNFSYTDFAIFRVLFPLSSVERNVSHASNNGIMSCLRSVVPSMSLRCSGRRVGSNESIDICIIHSIRRVVCSLNWPGTGTIPSSGDIGEHELVRSKSGIFSITMRGVGGRRRGEAVSRRVELSLIAVVVLCSTAVVSLGVSCCSLGCPASWTMVIAISIMNRRERVGFRWLWGAVYVRRRGFARLRILALFTTRPVQPTPQKPKRLI